MTPVYLEPKPVPYLQHHQQQQQQQPPIQPSMSTSVQNCSGEAETKPVPTTAPTEVYVKESTSPPLISNCVAASSSSPPATTVANSNSNSNSNDNSNSGVNDGSMIGTGTSAATISSNSSNNGLVEPSYYDPLPPDAVVRIIPPGSALNCAE